MLSSVFFHTANRGFFPDDGIGLGTVLIRTRGIPIPVVARVRRDPRKPSPAPFPNVGSDDD